MAEGRSVGALRIDLPPGDPDPAASTILGMLCRIAHVDAFVAIVYTDAGVADGLPHAALAAALGRCADASGLRLVDALVIAADGWGSHLDADASAQIRPLGELITTSASDVPAVSGDQGSGAELPAVDAAAREQVDAALHSLRASLELLCGVGAADPDGGEPDDDADAADSATDDGAAPSARRIDPSALAAVCELDDLPRLYERALGWDASTLRPIDAAVLTWCLARPALRDVALVQWSGDVVRGEDALDAQHKWEDEGAEYPVALASVLWGEGPRPDPARLEDALWLCRHVAAMSPQHVQAGALAVCAWLSWALGRSTHADIYAAMAYESDPEHGLAAIVRSFVAAGHLPDWAFR